MMIPLLGLLRNVTTSFEIYAKSLLVQLSLDAIATSFKDMLKVYLYSDLSMLAYSPILIIYLIFFL